MKSDRRSIFEETPVFYDMKVAGLWAIARYLSRAWRWLKRWAR